MKDYKYRFTVFTATYNRATYLPKLYNDLLNQTVRGNIGYEWIVVSDGSSDNTADVVNSFIKEGKIPIKFVDKENGGKHTAYSAACKLSEGRYLITADDDDPVDSNMLDVFDTAWKELEQSPVYNQFWEVKARCRYEDGTLVGEPLPSPYYDSDYIDIEYRLKKSCEMISCYKTEIMQTEGEQPNDFPFKEYTNYIPEGITWMRIARKYKTRFIPDILRTYVVGHESLMTSTSTEFQPRRVYTGILAALYSVNEQRDLMFKFDKRKYIAYMRQLILQAEMVDNKNAVRHELIRKTDRMVFDILALLLKFFPLLKNIHYKK